MFNFRSVAICLVFSNVLFDKSTSLPLNSNDNLNDDSKVYHINFNQNQQRGGDIKLQRSIERITYPDDGVSKRENQFIDSYGNPIKSELNNIKNNEDAPNPLLIKEKPDTVNHQFVIPGYASGIYSPNDTLKRSTDTQNVNDNILFGEHHEGVPIVIPAPAVYITFPYNPDQVVDTPKPLQAPASVGGAFPNGPLIITEDVLFAEKPSDGLLPPKETSIVDVYYYSKEDKKEDGQQLNIKPSQTNLPPKIDTAFGAFGVGSPPNNQQPQIDLQPPNFINPLPSFQSGSQTTKIPFTRFQQPAGSIPPINKQTIDQSVPGKYTGGFGGSSGVLGGQQSASSFQNSNAIQPANQNALQNLPLSENEPSRYAGTFGGAPGVLGSNIAPSNAQPTSATLPRPANGGNLFNNKDAPGRYSGNFGGPSGVLSPIGSDASAGTAFLNKQPPTQVLPQLPDFTAVRQPSLAASADKYSGNFGGSPGILQPNDNVAH